jgi:hypothetical protein
MATSTINATYQGRVGISVSSFFVNWLSQVRNATTGTYASTYTTNITVSNAFLVAYDTGRSSQVGQCARVPLFFDVSSITASNTITAATLKVWNPNAGAGIYSIIVKGSAWGGNGSTTTLSTSDYDNLDFATAYSAKDVTWNGGGAYNDFTMNVTAISDMNTNGYLNCFLIEGDFDYDGQSPVIDDGPYQGSVEYLDATNKIKVELTYAPSGYANKPLGVTPDNVGEILGVAKASVSKFLGV